MIFAQVSPPLERDAIYKGKAYKSEYCMFVGTHILNFVCTASFDVNPAQSFINEAAGEMNGETV